MSEEFISIVDLKNVVRVRVSDNVLKFIEETQYKMKTEFPGMNTEATIKYPDFDSMEPTNLTLRIEKYKWEIGYYSYDGFEGLDFNKSMVPYMWFENCEAKLWRYRSKDKSRWKSDVINFLTGKERIEMISNWRD